MLARMCVRKFATIGAPPPGPPPYQSWLRMMSATTVGILIAELVIDIKDGRATVKKN